MKRFRTTLLALTLTLILTPLLQSCLDDDDNYYVTIATFRTNEDVGNYFTMDNGKTLHTQQVISSLEDGQRVNISFDILEEDVNGYDYTIKVRGLEKILTKPTITMTEETADSIGDDKINIIGIWLGDGYLNINYQFIGSRYSTKPHMINLVNNQIEGTDEESEEGYLSLEFRHNAYGDNSGDVLNGIVSFKGPFKEEDLSGLKVRYNSIYNGVKYTKIDFEKKD